MKILLLVMLSLLLFGCGKVANETSGGGSSSTTTITQPPETPTPSPNRILEPYTDNGWAIVFTAPTGDVYISEIHYGTVMMEKIVVTVLASCPYSSLTFAVNGTWKHIPITGAGTYTAWTQNGTGDARNLYLNNYTLPLDKLAGNFEEIKGDGNSLKI